MQEDPPAGIGFQLVASIFFFLKNNKKKRNALLIHRTMMVGMGHIEMEGKYTATMN